MTYAALAPRERAVRETVFAPPPRMTLSEWADAHALVHVGAEKGRWRTDRAPYQRGIMEAISDPTIPEIVWMKSARTGYTEIITKAIARHAHIDPCEILVVQPDQFTAERWSRTYLVPEFRDTPALADRVKTFAEGGARHSGNTLLRKEFPGGDVTCVWASSANRLRFSTNRVVIFDEIDGYPPNKEGDPIGLGRKRAETYGRRRKIVQGSSPTIKGLSRIERAFEASDQRYFFVPCPDCGHRQRLVWANVRWEEGQPETAAYACEDCGTLIPHHKKQGMLRAAAAFPGWGWIATKPEAKVAGFHISALYSPWVTWAELVEAWLAAQHDLEKLQSFVNTALGETWEERNESFRPEGLLARRETYVHPCPAEVNVITCATDVQGDRTETLWCGWGRGRELWLLKHQVFVGDPAESPKVTGSVWQQLDGVITTAWTHGDSGRTLPVAAAAVDSGFLTPEVYAYTGPRYGRRIYAVKGGSKDEVGKGLVNRRPSVDDRSGARFFVFRPSTAKDSVFAMLKVQQVGPRYIHLPEWFDADHAAQLTAEKLVRRVGRDGSVKRKYVKKGRNEMLDLVVMNLVALALSGRDPDVPAQTLAPTPPADDDPTPTPPTPRRAVQVTGGRRGGWVSGWGER